MFSKKENFNFESLKLTHKYNKSTYVDNSSVRDSFFVITYPVSLFQHEKLTPQDTINVLRIHLPPSILLLKRESEETAP